MLLHVHLLLHRWYTPIHWCTAILWRTSIRSCLGTQRNQHGCPATVCKTPRKNAKIYKKIHGGTFMREDCTPRTHARETSTRGFFVHWAWIHHDDLLAAWLLHDLVLVGKLCVIVLFHSIHLLLHGVNGLLFIALRHGQGLHHTRYCLLIHFIVHACDVCLSKLRLVILA